jgi:predicted transcriptional regulator
MSYYNTTNLKGAELKAAQDKARTQEQDVYEILFLANRPLGASEVMERLNRFNKRPPITSVRRAISNLKKSGLVERAERQIIGPYGRREYAWTLRTKEQVNVGK